MKQFFAFVIILISSCASAQKETSSIQDFFWGNIDEKRNATTVPDNLKNESAVILYQYEYYGYPKSGTIRKWESGMRKRVKLQDQAAIKEYSEFSFKEKSANKNRYGYSNSIFGIKIIKANGTEIQVDVDKESVKADDEKKIAIANLEVGDIIDFYIFKSDSELSQNFEPVESVIGEIYPILNLKVEVEMARQYSINWKSYNGAPDLQELPLGEKDQKRYEFTMSDIPKNEFPRWFYPYVELPCYKFKANITLGKDKKTITEAITREDVFKSYSERFRPYGDMQHIEKFLKGKEFSSDEEKVREVYYFTRHYYFTQYVEAFVINEANIFYPFELYKNPIFLKNEDQFIDHFMAFLKDNKIDYDIVVATPRFNGPMSDLILWSNLSTLLRVNTTPNPVYLEYFSPFTNADQFSSELENSDAYLLNVVKRKKVTDVESIHLPSSTADDNRTKVVSNISFDAQMSGLKVSRESSYFGHFKEDEQDNRMNFYDYVDEDYKKYGTEPVLERVRNDKKQAQYKKEYAALVNKLRDKQKETFSKSVSGEFDLKIENYIFEVTNTGRFGKREPFTFHDEFALENHLVKKAGENYILEIGKMLTGQVEIDKKEKNRKNNIYMAFPRSFENEIILEIPKGYTVSGLEKLAKNVSNATGSFSSTARIEGEKLVVKTKKSYSNYYEPNANWPQMVDFLEAAYQFTQEKILLKKA